MFWKKKDAVSNRAARAEALWKQGAHWLEKRKIGPAIEAMQAAMELEPSRLEGRLNLGAALYLANRPAEAVAHLRYVLAFEAQNSMALLNLAACYDALGDLETSVQTLEQLVRDRPQWRDAHYNLGVAYYKQKNYDAAITALRAELVLNSKHEAARDLLNKIHLMPSRARREARDSMNARHAAPPTSAVGEAAVVATEESKVEPPRGAPEAGDEAG